jgi:hypothetical protein
MLVMSKLGDQMLVFAQPVSGHRWSYSFSTHKKVVIGLMHKNIHFGLHHGTFRGTSLREVGRPILDAKATISLVAS